MLGDTHGDLSLVPCLLLLVIPVGSTQEGPIDGVHIVQSPGNWGWGQGERWRVDLDGGVENNRDSHYLYRYMFQRSWDLSFQGLPEKRDVDGATE